MTTEDTSPFDTNDAIETTAKAEAAASEATSATLPVLTYSAESAFQRCRKLYFWQYVRGIRVVGDDEEPLWHGSLWHDMAEIRDRLRMRGFGRDDALAWALAWLAKQTTGRAGDPKKRLAWLMLSEGFTAYDAKGRSKPVVTDLPDDERFANLDYLWISDDDFELVDIEGTVVTDLRNPETGAKSRSFLAALKTDGLIRINGDLWLLERKLLSDLGDIERLWTDYQIARYGQFVQRKRGEPVRGAVYDVAVKTRMRPKEAYLEPMHEWTTRVEAKIHESKEKLREKAAAKGKTLTVEEIEKDEARVRALKTMQRTDRKAETDQEFALRLRGHFAKPSSIVRIRVPFDEERLEDAESIAWDSSQQLLDARRREKYRKNLSACYQYGRACQFVTLCRDRLDPERDQQVASLYEPVRPNRELDDSSFGWVLEMLDAGADPEEIVANARRVEETALGFFDKESIDGNDGGGEDADDVAF